jgi:hypothetical protein
VVAQVSDDDYDVVSSDSALTCPTQVTEDNPPTEVLFDSKQSVSWKVDLPEGVHIWGFRVTISGMQASAASVAFSVPQVCRLACCSRSDEAGGLSRRAPGACQLLDSDLPLQTPDNCVLCLRLQPDDPEWTPLDGWVGTYLRIFTLGNDGFKPADVAKQGLACSADGACTLTFANISSKRLKAPNLSVPPTAMSEWQVEVAVLNMDAVSSSKASATLKNS